MSTSKLIPICLWLIVGGALLGGCPATAPVGDSLGLAGGPDDSQNSQPAADTPGEEVLGEVVSNLARSDSGDELASSESSGAVSIGSDSYPEGVYPPGYNPFTRDTGDNGDHHADSGDDGAGGDAAGGDGAGGGTGGGDSGGGASSGGGDNGPTSQFYVGSVGCVRSEELLGYGGYSEDLTYYIGLDLDDAGVPDTIPVPMFVTKNMYKAPVLHPGQTDVHQEVFSPDGTAFTVTITVRSATYSPTGMHTVFDIDVKWIGEHSRITATGTHTVDTQVGNGSLVWSSTTHYDARLQADADWQGTATEDFTCSGTLPAQ